MRGPNIGAPYRKVPLSWREGAPPLQLSSNNCLTGGQRVSWADVVATPAPWPPGTVNDVGLEWCGVSCGPVLVPAGIIPCVSVSACCGVTRQHSDPV